MTHTIITTKRECWQTTFKFCICNNICWFFSIIGWPIAMLIDNTLNCYGNNQSCMITVSEMMWQVVEEYLVIILRPERVTRYESFTFTHVSHTDVVALEHVCLAKFEMVPSGLKMSGPLGTYTSEISWKMWTPPWDYWFPLGSYVLITYIQISQNRDIKLKECPLEDHDTLV